LRIILWPRSLLWRTFILLAALVLVTTAAWFGIFRAYELEPRARQISQNLVSIVNLTRTALITSQPERRHELLSELSEREGIQVYPEEPGERIAPPADRPLVRLVSEMVRRQLGENTRFASERDGKPGFWLSFHIDDDEYWVRVPRERIERQIALRWLGWGALAVALSLLAALVLVTTAAWFGIFRAYELEPRARQISQNLVSIVNLTRTALITSQPERRHELLLELSEREGIQVYPEEPGERIAPPADRPLVRLVSEMVRRQLGENTRFASERDGKPGF